MQLVTALVLQQLQITTISIIKAEKIIALKSEIKTVLAVKLTEKVKN